MGWGATTIESRQYRCGHCGSLVASDFGFADRNKYGDADAVIMICPHCAKPTYFDGYVQVPGVAPGNEISHLPQDIESLYGEARRCIAVGADTSAVLTCRKLLMHLAVERGAGQDLSFIKYVEYLAGQGYVPPDGQPWVDHIRKKGNEATHEIVLMSDEDAVELISFVEMLLKFMYEFPARLLRPKSSG